MHFAWKNLLTMHFAYMQLCKAYMQCILCQNHVQNHSPIQNLVPQASEQAQLVSVPPPTAHEINPYEFPVKNLSNAPNSYDPDAQDSINEAKLLSQPDLFNAFQNFEEMKSEKEETFANFEDNLLGKKEEYLSPGSSLLSIFDMKDENPYILHQAGIEN